MSTSRSVGRWARVAVALLAGIIGLAPTAVSGAAPREPDHGRVLRVGTWKDARGQFRTIQAAVDAARPGDWILVAPGDYHEQADHRLDGHAQVATGGVMITTPRIHLRGLSRGGVIVDGTKPGAPPCSSALGDQDLGPRRADGRPAGRNGIEVFKADGVTVQNLTVCNFLDGAGGGGNQIWFNGGDGSGTIGMGPYRGEYLSATTTFWQAGQPQAEYGIFASNARGPGAIVHTYASNMADSSYYVGACPDCNAWVLDAHAQHSALGYSGTNAGGHLVIGFSQWDDNKTGISTNSQNNDDAPSPQDGSCPNGGRGPTGTGSCTFFVGNWIHDNNDPNVPGSGTAQLGPVGTGMVLAGGRHDTIAANRVERNGAWGLLLVPFPDSETPPPIAHCEGGVTNPGGLLGALGITCFFDDFGNEVAHNRLAGNGAFGNPTNGDLAEISGLNNPGNCWHDNVDPAGVTSAPADLQVTHRVCRVPNQGADITSTLSQQVICDIEVFGPCPPVPGQSYPRRTQVTLMPLPNERSMRNPCADVGRNPWCRDRD